jgi:GT2 family glycosyltransferase
VSTAAITVGVAACGRPEGLARCLAALAGQTSPPAEVVVVDQDPSDAARDALAGSGLAGARYLEQPRLGLSASRNLALDAATKPLLAVTDDDCAPDPGWLAAVTAALEQPPRPDAVTGPILPLGDRLPGTYAVSLRESRIRLDHSGRVLPWTVGTGANFCARVELLHEVGGWDERLGAGSPGQAAEDSELMLRLLDARRVVRYEPDAVVRHEWQTREQRLASRWSYGYGIGAMSGLRLADRDGFALRMLGGYARLHLRPLLGALKRRDRDSASERARALASLAPGVVYGLRAAGRPSSGGERRGR